jgi:nickel-dependent lactate racemase
MRVHLAYGTDGLDVEVPDDAVVVEPDELPGLADERAAIAAVVRRRLPDLIAASGTRRPRVAVAFPDLTRPMPNATVLPPLLAALVELGLGPDEVTLLCATGTHRRATEDEMAALVGPEVWGSWPIHDHDADDGEHVDVGRVDGAPVLLDRRWVAADVRIATGFVEPHFFAGFSGGPKGVCPGLAGLETILEAHSPARIASPNATWTVLEGNPVHDFVRAAAARCPAHLTVDVAINSARAVTSVFDDHHAACRFVERTAVRRVPGRFDVVVSTNSGHPLDRNLYQAVKGMAAAERVVAPGGTVVMAAACVDGVPAEGDFGRLVAAAATPAELVDAAAPRGLDRWQAQVLGRVLSSARVQLRSDGLSADEVRAALLEPVADVTAAVAASVDEARRAGRPGRVCVLPQGPQTVATAVAREP